MAQPSSATCFGVIAILHLFGFPLLIRRRLNWAGCATARFQSRKKWFEARLSAEVRFGSKPENRNASKCFPLFTQ
jgi:hypothetical protein